MTEQDQRYASGCFAFYFLWVVSVGMFVIALQFITKVISTLLPNVDKGVSSIIWIFGLVAFLWFFNILHVSLGKRWRFYSHLNDMVEEFQRQNQQAQQKKFRSKKKDET